MAIIAVDLEALKGKFFSEHYASVSHVGYQYCGSVRRHLEHLKGKEAMIQISLRKIRHVTKETTFSL